MAESQFGAASFEFYEGIRILLPGAIVAALFASVTVTFFERVPDFPGGQALGVITLAVFAGLVAYFVDAPAKSAAFKENTPNQLLDDWHIRPPVGVRSSLNVYFVLLDELVPAPIRARALYMGSIYRIGFELIYLLGAVSITVLAAAAAKSVTAQMQVEPIPVGFLTLFLGLSVASFTWAVYVQAHRRSDGSVWAKSRATLADAMRQASSGWFGLPAATVLCMVGILRSRDAWQLMIAVIAILVWIWMVRYFRGYRRTRGGAFQRLDPPAAVLLFLLPAMLASFYLWQSGGVGVPGQSTGALLAWAAAAITTSVLIAARGHEKRLGGSYATQRTWLQYNKAAVMNIYGGRRMDPSDPV